MKLRLLTLTALLPVAVFTLPACAAEVVSVVPTPQTPAAPLPVASAPAPTAGAAQSPSPAAAPTTAEAQPNVVERLSKVFRFADDPPAARALALPYLKGGSRALVVIPFYQMDPYDAPSGGWALGTSSAGWDRLTFRYYTYVVVNTVTNVVTKDVQITDQGKPGTFREVSFNGGAGQSKVSALLDLAVMEIVRAGSYEPRILQFGGIKPGGAGVEYVIWLRSVSGTTDLIYTYSSNSNYGLKPNTLYPVDQFNAQIQLGYSKYLEIRPANWARTMMLR